MKGFRKVKCESKQSALNWFRISRITVGISRVTAWIWPTAASHTTGRVVLEPFRGYKTTEVCGYFTVV